MPGGTLLTRLKVYDSAGPDGLRGGTPHVHLVCTELYYVLSGTGSVELLDRNGFSTAELSPHAALLFNSGTIHRLINPKGDLDILIMMQNSGLPERGDNVVTFQNEMLADPSRYAAAMKAETLSDALRRRDRGVEGFLELKAAFAESKTAGQRALDEFYKLAALRTKPVHQEWYKRVTNGAFEDAQESLHKIIELSGGKTEYLRAARHEFIPAADCAQVGFCGQLYRYFDEATLQLDGTKF